MNDLQGIGPFIERYGLPLFMFLATTGLWMAGKLRAEREVDRERQISDAKDAIISKKDEQIATLVGELKDNTAVMNRVASGIEERNRIETQMRGRRT